MPSSRATFDGHHLSLLLVPGRALTPTGKARRPWFNTYEIFGCTREKTKTKTYCSADRLLNAFITCDLRRASLELAAGAWAGLDPNRKGPPHVFLSQFATKPL